MFDSTISDEIDIKHFILKDYTCLKLAEPTIEIVFENEQKRFQHNGQLRCKNLIFPFAKDGERPTFVPIKNISTITEACSLSGVKEVCELVLNTENTAFEEFSPGDTIAILPNNNESEVNFLLRSMQLTEKADHVCKVQLRSKNPQKNIKYSHIPEETTPRELLSDILNIRAIPKKQFLRGLAEHCAVPEDAEFFNCLSSKEGSKYYNELLLEKGINLIDLLAICYSCQPDLRLLVEHLPRLLPRPYSIANSPLARNHDLKIIFSLLSRKPGATTGMLADIKAKKHQTQISSLKLIVYLRQLNNFRYTSEDFERNQILIAIGTGLSPFLGFLEHKALLAKTKNSNPGETWLFMGASTEAAIPYRVQILKYQNQGALQRYFESLSRVSDTNFHYVQDQLLANAHILIKLFMNDETILYVCADGAAISLSISACFTKCLEQELHLTSAEATDMLKKFRSNGKYREDLWT